MENVLSVVNSELKVKNWFIKNSPKEVKTTLISNLSMEINENDNGKTYQKSTSAVTYNRLFSDMDSCGDE